MVRVKIQEAKIEKTRIKFKELDFLLISIYAILLVFGLIVLKSALLGSKLESLWLKQLIWSFIGVITFVLAFRIKEETLKTYIDYIFYSLFILLILVLFYGTGKYGAKRWLDLVWFSFQPSVFFELAEVIILAKILSEDSLKRFLFVSVLIFSAAFLIFKEPDLGTSIFVIAIWFTMIWISGRFEFVWKSFLLISIILSPVVIANLKPYQKARVLAFLFPQKHATSIAYNTLQSLRAIGSGGIFGSGYMNGFMNLGRFVPEDHTDFIVSVIGEEFGFLGLVFIIILYSFLIAKLFNIFNSVKNLYKKYVIFGFIIIFFFHIFENIGMALGILPVTGVPLPFISYGGSSMIVFSFMLGLSMKFKIIKE